MFDEKLVYVLAKDFRQYHDICALGSAARPRLRRVFVVFCVAAFARGAVRP